MEKSPDAFRTISEVAEWLDIPTHVLRFWESRFAQIKPVKRAGGRRYYRPSDMRLIGGVKTLLHDQGMTIRGVQKILREHGVKHVSSFSQSLDTELEDTADETVIDHTPAPSQPAPAARETYAAEPAPEPVPEPASEPDAPVAADTEETDGTQPDMFPLPADRDDPVPMPTFVPSRSRSTPAPEAEPEVAAAPEPTPEPAKPQIPATPDVPDTDPGDDDPTVSDAPGIAARLATLPTAQLAAHKDTLKTARDRLVALRDAQS
ncbi:MAG: MerR family transcriptional regulator [Boseongicola sp.]|nr:MerR family transcriptional regulator [Boseongicola sp.]